MYFWFVFHIAVGKVLLVWGALKRSINCGDELSQYNLKRECVWGLSLGINSDLFALSFPLYLFFCTQSFCHFGIKIGWTQTALCSVGLAWGRPMERIVSAGRGETFWLRWSQPCGDTVVVPGSLVRCDGPLPSAQVSGRAPPTPVP